MRHITVRLAALGWALAAIACAPPAPDAILFNGKIFTADPAQPWAEALAIRGERIVAVGDDSAIRAQAGPSTRRIDVVGRTVVPGFNDAHVEISNPTAAAVQILGADALTHGVTSIQVFSAGPVADTVRAFAEADLPLRVRVIRMPEPAPSGVNRDSRPYFPPQPGPRLDARGMGFQLRAHDAGRLQQAVGWAYGSEDPLAVGCLDEQTLEAYVAALETAGAADVWKAKRPRLEHPASVPAGVRARLALLGVVVVQSPREGAPLKSILLAGIPLAFGSAGALRGLDMVRSATAPGLGDESLTREEAVAAYGRGSAAAEFAEREKGHLSVGALADLAVLSADIFTVPAEELKAIGSVLTMIGGRSVYDVSRP